MRFVSRSPGRLARFFPACLVMLAIFKNVLQWDGAYKILLTTVKSYFPTSQATVVAGLDNSVHLLGNRVQWGSLLWVLLGRPAYSFHWKWH
jgi:hypothetical protein